MDDPHFAQSVTYICEHTDQGAMGLIVNHPLQISLPEVLSSIGITEYTPRMAGYPIFAGGPVQKDRGFVLHRSTHKRWQSSLPLNEDLTITTSRDILIAMASNKGPQDALVTLGYAGWSAGQLEEEMASNLWLCCPAKPELLFDVPAEERWHAAAESAGIDLSRMVLQAGHA